MGAGNSPEEPHYIVPPPPVHTPTQQLNICPVDLYQQPYPPQAIVKPGPVHPTASIFYVGQPDVTPPVDDSDDDSKPCGYFALGLVLSFLLGLLALLFFACAKNAGIVGRRRTPFLSGVIVGCISNTIIAVVMFYVYFRTFFFY